jgi:Mandelate racemase / muconate lactonizing enzyme, N-terminal domain/Enolase C-terminal domain-like
MPFMTAVEPAAPPHAESPEVSRMDAPETAVARLDPGSLAIDRIETIALRAPLGRRFSGSAYSMDNRCTIVVRLTTADGIVAETYSGDTDEEQALITGIIHDELAPVILGRSARDPEGRWRDMEPSTNNILRDRGLALQAIAALDTAIWDALGRAVGLPLYRLWGAVTDEVPISVIGGYYHLDAAGTAKAVVFARRVTDLDLRWFEEPCRWTNDRRWMRDVRYMGGVAVWAGQSETTLHRLLDLIVDGAIDVSNSTPHGRAGRRSGARPPGCAPRSGSGWGTTRSPRSAPTSWRPCRTTPSPSASTRSATRSSGAAPTSPRESPAAGTSFPTPGLRHQPRLGRRARAHGRDARERAGARGLTAPDAMIPGAARRGRIEV